MTEYLFFKELIRVGVRKLMFVPIMGEGYNDSRQSGQPYYRAVRGYARDLVWGCHFLSKDILGLAFCGFPLNDSFSSPRISQPNIRLSLFHFVVPKLIY